MSFPPHNLSFLAFVALVPLWLALYDASAREGALWGFLCGFIFYLSLFAWADGFGLEVRLALSVQQALFWALYGALVGWYGQKAGGWKKLVFPLFAFMGMEWLKSLGPLGLIWGNLGYSQYLNLPLIQSVSRFGYYGLAFLVLLGDLAVYSLLLRAVKLDRSRLPVGLLFLLLLSADWLYGAAVLRSCLQLRSPFKAALVQVDMDMKIKWNREFLEKTMTYLERSTQDAARQGARLVVFPETSVPDDFLFGSSLDFRLRETARRNRVYLLFGVPRPGPEGCLNAAMLISPRGEFLGEYDKRHLVPFAEYLPLKQWLRRFALFDRVQNFIPGSREVIFTPSLGRFGVLTCFESAFSAPASAKIRQGAQFLVVITNDAWFELSSAAEHHLSWGVFRALENRSWFLQAANTGISAFISPRGEIVRHTALYQRTVLVGDAGLKSSARQAFLPGDWFLFPALGVFFLLLALRGREKPL